MNKILKFSIYGFCFGVIYSFLSMGPFLLCKFTGIGATDWRLGTVKLSGCDVNFLLKPFAIFYRDISIGKGLFFSASNFVLVGEVLIMLIAFTVLGALVGIIINQIKK